MTLRKLVSGIAGIVLAFPLLVACSSPPPRVEITEESLTQVVDSGTFRFRLPEDAYLEGSEPGNGPSDYSFVWRIPGMFGVFVMHTGRGRAPYRLDELGPFSEEATYPVEVEGAVEARRRADMTSGDSLIVVRPCGATTSIGFIGLEGAPWDLSDYHEVIDMILSTVEVTDGLYPLLEDAEAGPLRFRLPAGGAFHEIRANERYVTPIWRGGPVPFIDVTLGENSNQRTLVCDTPFEVPGAQGSALCRTEDEGDYTSSAMNGLVLHVELVNGEIWQVFGQAIANEPIVVAIFDTITVDPDWSRQ